MKTSTIALAFMAASAEALLNLDVNLPAGLGDINLDILGEHPHGEPCGECSDVWHPPHDVIIDGCDDFGNHGWHYVHPCNEEPTESYTWTQSTVTAHSTSTIYSCAPTVTDCPARVTTVTVPERTTICPAPVHPTGAPAPAPTGPSTAPVVVPSSSSVWQAPPSSSPVWQAPPSSSPVWQAPPPATPAPGAPAPVTPVPAASSPYIPSVTLSTWTTPYVAPTPVAPVTPGAPGVVSPPPANNGTLPPTAGAAQNVQGMGVVAVAALAAVAML